MYMMRTGLTSGCFVRKLLSAGGSTGAARTPMPPQRASATVDTFMIGTITYGKRVERNTRIDLVK